MVGVIISKKVVSIPECTKIRYFENAIRRCLDHYCPDNDTITHPMSLSDNSYLLLLHQFKKRL